MFGEVYEETCSRQYTRFDQYPLILYPIISKYSTSALIGNKACTSNDSILICSLVILVIFRDPN